MAKLLYCRHLRRPVLLCTRPIEPMTTSPGQTGKGFRWAVTILAVVALIGLGFTARFWVPWLLEIAHTKKETVDSLNTLLDLVAKLVCWPAAAIVFVMRLWRDKKGAEESIKAGTFIKAGGSIRAGGSIEAGTGISAGGDILTGGQKIQQTGEGNVGAQGEFRVGGDFVQQKIEYKTEVREAPLPSLHELPEPPGDFQGRERELEELRAGMKAATTAGRAVISGLRGQGGIGKTALALKLAQELSEGYPDGQIYLDLKGASEKPVPVSEALAYVIRAFHPEAKLPERQDELEGIYHTVLHEKSVLLLMDNARDAAQVAPLIPPQGCAFLVTSRLRFTLPGLFAKDLEVLPPGDAEALLLAIAPRIGGQARVISGLCGFLPLALRLAANALANRKDLSPTDYVRQLGDEKKRLQLLKGGDESVEASIGLSYGLLDEQTQKRWRILGVFPDTFDAPAAAAVWEAETNAAQNILGVLMQYSMLEWNETSRRYGLHDLMRDFARARLDLKELDDAGQRHAAHYLQVLKSADDLYAQGGDALKRALVQFDAEWSNIQAGQAWACNHAATSAEAAQLCSNYPERGTFLLFLRQHPREQIRWRELGLSAARQLRDRPAEGRHVGNLGIAYHALGEYRRAIEYQEKSLAIAREIGDRRGEGQALGNLGIAYYSLGEYRRAIEYHEMVLVIAREIGDRRGEGNALGNLGNAYNSLGEYRRAIEYQEKRLAIAREIGDRRGEGNAFFNTSVALNQLGERGKAIERARAALQILERIESPHAEMVRKQIEEWEGHGG